ncbi:uncharacterized protein LOC126195531 [Schistocerca nitens]|uniref:uncharacterized protein LOC126195531 n=1 Tax=Schistocerca nitens TaxID=7011 RepID=UPI002117AFA9|nr:uncharacterized protein LOC126195531 [Schistocerca nitens]
MTTITKDVMLKKLADWTCILINKVGVRSGSSSWEKFKVVVERDAHLPVGYVQCQNGNCGALLAYKGSTTGMNRHKCKDNRHFSSVAAASVDKISIREKCVLMCATDLRPFNMEQISAQDVLPSPRTVARRIKELADQVSSERIPVLKDAIGKNPCSMTCDPWTDSYRKTYYLTVTSIYIDESTDKWKIKNSVLLTKRFLEVAKTGEHIITEIHEQMAELQITSSELRQVTFDTDQGANIKKGLEAHKRLPCVMHCINTALRHTFNEGFLVDEIPAAYDSILTIRKLVGFMKRSGLVARLDKTLHHDVETRWNSVYMMLDSFHS